jgi:hypothetical protein
MRLRLAALLLCLTTISASAASPIAQGRLSTTTCPGAGCITLPVSGLTRVGVQVTGTFTGTLTFETSIDGVTYTALNMTPPNSTTPATTATAAGLWNGTCAGFSIVRARFSAYTDGSAVVTLQGAP